MSEAKYTPSAGQGEEGVNSPPCISGSLALMLSGSLALSPPIIIPSMAQSNYELVLKQSFEGARTREQSAFLSLGAADSGGGNLELPMFNEKILVNMAEGRIWRLDDAPVSVAWKILTVHYLQASLPVPVQKGWTSYSEIPDVRGYLGVYRKRVIDRLCATAGRERATFVGASQALGGKRVNEKWGDEGFLYRVFPFLPVGIAWYAGDDELPPGASFLYPDNVGSILCAEDMVVLAESVVGRLTEAMNRGNK